MELFRNVGIRSRIIVTNLLLLLLPIGITIYIRWADINPNLRVWLFLGNIFLFIGLVTSYLVGSSVLGPIERVRKRVRNFVQQKIATPVKDFGADEVSELSGEVNHLFTAWNVELLNIMKKQKIKGEESIKAETERSELGNQLHLARSCLRVAQQLNTTFDFQTNLKLILDEAVKTMNVQWASLLLLNRDTLEMQVAGIRGVEQSLLDDLTEDQYPAIKLKPNEGLAGQVIRGGVPLIANKGHKDPRFKGFSEFKARDEKIASLLCAPIKGTDGSVLGVINFVNRISPPVFRNEDLPFAEDLCTLATLVIERNRLYRNIFKDEGTGLTTHNVWKGYFEEEASRAVRYSQPLSLVIIDIDHFKELVAQTNSEFGLMVNNDFGRMLPQLLRDADIGSRAQDRYYLLLPNTDAAGAVFLVGRIKEALEKMNFQFAGVTFSVTASAGIATFPDPQSDARALLPCALKALDAAKAGGRNRAIIHGSGTGSTPAS